MASFLAVTLSLLILEPDMPRRKSPKSQAPTAATNRPDPVIAALLTALDNHASPAADALRRLLDRFDAPGDNRPMEDSVRRRRPEVLEHPGPGRTLGAAVA